MTSSQHTRVVALAVVSGAAAAFSAAEPSGWHAVALVELFLFGSGVAVLGAYAGPLAALVLPVAAGVTSAEGGVALTLAAAGVVAGLLALWQGPGRMVSSALAAGFGVNALLRLPVGVTPRDTVVAGIVGIVPLIVIALVRGPRGVRLGIVVAGAVLSAVVAMSVTALLVLRNDASDGLAMARRGVRATQQGDDVVAARAFGGAAIHLQRVHATTTAWWASPARVVPGLSQQFDAVEAAAEAGARLARQARTSVAAIDPANLVTPDGAFDLAAIAAIEPDADQLLTASRRARRALRQADGPWLIPPIADPLDRLGQRLGATVRSARNVSDAVDLAGALLGADAPRRYLVLAVNPAEARELGGFTGGVGLLHATGGRLQFERGPSIEALDDRLAAVSPVMPEDLPVSLAALQPWRYAQNWSGTPDVPTLFEVATAGWSATDEGREVDGVVTVDPYAVRALLRLTGSVRIDGTTSRVDADTVVDYLLHGQYTDPAFGDGEARRDAVTDVAVAAFERLTTRRLPDPRRLARVLSPLIRARRISFASSDARARPLFTRLGLSRSLADLRVGDLMITTSNTRQSKLDAYLNYHVDVTTHRDSSTRGVDLAITVENDAPPGLPVHVLGGRRARDELPPGTAGVALTLYSAFGLARVTIDGTPAAASSTIEFGLQRHTLSFTVDAGATVTLRFALSSTASATRPIDYRLLPMPVANPVTVSVMGAGDGTRRLLDRVFDVTPAARR
jgi:hypothetical protein